MLLDNKKQNDYIYLLLSTYKKITTIYEAQESRSLLKGSNVIDIKKDYITKKDKKDQNV